ncbi:MAG: hypothetical protein R3C26_23750 [Calditrichia bacterium]
MKFTQYFLHTRNRNDRKEIKEDWIQKAIIKPQAEQVQSDGRIKRWIWIDEQQKFLRVVLLEDGETVHNAFFDRRFKISENEE